jgi:hypothetical protein
MGKHHSLYFSMLEGLFEMERDGSNQENHDKVFPDDDAIKSWNHAHKTLKKQGFIVDSPDGLTLTDAGRAEYLRLKAEDDAAP